MSRLVALYPRAWQARYGVEFAELLAARPPSVRDRLDIVLGAIDARINPQVPGADDRERSLAGDRAARVAAIATGVLLTIWGVVVASAMVPWDSGLELRAPAALVNLAWVCGILADLSGPVTFGIVVVRYARVLGSVGVAGAVMTPVGLLMSALGLGMVSLVVLPAGAVLFSWRANGRILSGPAAVAFAAGTVIAAASFLAFAAGNGHDVGILLPVAALGPAWILLGLGLREPRDMPARPATPTPRLAIAP